MKGDLEEGLHCKRVVFPRKGEVAVEDFELRQPRDNKVLIRTVSTLISPGTETAFLMALPNTPGRFPQYPGYSNAGVVVSMGSRASRFKVGDRVVSRKNHASHVIASENELMMIPKGLSFDEAAFFALGSIALQGIRKADIELGEPVVVLGQGLVGQLALQMAKLSGAMPIVGVDLFNYRLNLSLKNDADYVFNPLEVDLEKEISEVTAGRGANVVIEATGNRKVIPTAFKLVGKYGRVIILGSPRGMSEVNFYSEIHKKGICVIGAHESTRPRYESYHRWWTQRDDSSLVLKLINKGRLRVKDLITLKMNFQEAQDAYKELIKHKERVVGIILDWNYNK
ncbi:MAG: zinc-binding alcohol dehydrogenase [Candidatus Bathyarchaeia archaeon]